MLSAVVFIPSAEYEEAAAMGLHHGRAYGYHMEGLVVGRWEVVWAMVLADVVQVVIVADRSHLPPERVPRIEVLSEMAHLCRPIDGPPSPSPARRRPKSID